MAQKEPTQWHTIYHAALPMDFSLDRDILVFKNDFPLNELAIEADTIIIKKDRTAKTQNEIGAIFRGHNIVEYKSADDSLDIVSWIKAHSYAGFYIAGKKRAGSIAYNDVTVTLIRERKPVKLLGILKKEYQCDIQQAFPGIYYVKGSSLFPSQIVVIKEPEGIHPFLKLANPHTANVSQLVDLFRFREAESDSGMIEYASSLFGYVAGKKKTLLAQFHKEHPEMTHPAILEFYAEDFKAQEEKINELESEIAVKNKALSKKDQALSKKDQALSKKNQALSRQKKVISQKDQTLSKQQQRIKLLEEMLRAATGSVPE